MRSATLALTVALALTGCAGHQDMMPAASVGPPPDTSLVGVWRGSFSGREFVTGNGPIDGSAVLTLEPDGRWTLVERRSGAEVRSSGTARMAGSRLILDGHIDRGSPARARVTHVVRPSEGDRLAGRGDTFFLSNRAAGGLDVRRE